MVIAVPAEVIHVQLEQFPVPYQRFGVEPALLIVTALRDVALFSPSQILPTHRRSGLIEAIA
jgi:hypothetical protein